MPLVTYTFDTPGNYTFDNTEMQINAGSASLVLQSGALAFNQDFASDVGFTYDNTEIEFTAGLAQQLDVTPATSVFGVSYDVNANPITNEANLNWHKSAGNLTATLNGVPTIAGNQLVCVGTQGVYYQRNSSVIETHKFIYTPNYTSTPPSNVNIFSVYNGTDDVDRFVLTHSPSGNTLRLTLNDDAGINVIPVATPLGAAWTPTAGQDYEFEVVLDSVADTVRVFIDGVLHGTNNTGIWTRGTAATRYYLGASPTIYGTAEGNFSDYIMFTDAQHVASYTPGYIVDLTLYTETVVVLPLFTHAGLESVQSFTSLTTIQTGLIQYSIAADAGASLYWNGTMWTPSNGTYAQSNDLATLNAFFPLYPGVDGTNTATVTMYFPGSNAKADIDNLTLVHTGNTTYPLTNPTIIPITSVSQDQIKQFTATENIAGLDSIQYTLSVDTVEYWYDGATWSVSNGTYAQSNDIATVQANIATFTVKGVLVPVVYLHADSGLTTPSIDLLTIDFDFFAGASTPENVCAVWGYLYDELDQPVSGVIVTVTPTSFGVITDKLISRTPKQITTDTTGYWEIKLIETASTSNNWAYEFKLPGYTSTRVVPDKASESFNNLAEAVLP
jgi:hypothetical protein